MKGAERSRFRKWLKRGAIFVVIILGLSLAPVVWVETSCYSERSEQNRFQSLLSPEFRREEVNSYLTYPEWSIVHAYQDLAAVMRRSSASDFPYWSRIKSYWRSLCDIAGYSSARGNVSGEYRAMLHIIGVSFSVEMAVKGLYEKTIGRLTVWSRGDEKTPEDLYALDVADDYAAFLRQTPWFEFPFAAKLGQFWSETPFGSSDWLRATERRIALTLEYGGKSVYAVAIGALAATVPGQLRIRSVVEGGDPSGIEGIQIVERLSEGKTIIETPRYAAFTKIIRDLAAANISFSEIAGNDDIMLAVLVPPTERLAFDGATQLLSVPVEFRPGWRRNMITIPVSGLSRLIREIDARQAELEHIYDY